MKKLSINQKQNIVAGAAKKTTGSTKIGSYLKIFSISGLINLGVGAVANLLNIGTSSIKAKRSVPPSMNIPEPPTKNVATKNMIINM